MKTQKQNEPQLSAENRPRRFGKSTLVTDAFRAESLAGNSVKFEHQDYVCFSRKAWKEQQKAAKQAIATALEEQRAEILNEIESWLVDEEVTQRYSGGVYINGKCVSSMGCCNVGELKKEVETKNGLHAELRAKLEEMKGETICR